MTYRSKYIKTKVDNTPKILHLVSCNLCPFLIFGNDKRTARCAKYHSIRTDVIDDNIYSYTVSGSVSVPIKELIIPEWCGLSEGISLVNATGDMFVRNGHNSYEIVPHIYQNLVVVSSLYADYDQGLTRLVSAPNKNRLSFSSYNANRALPEKTTTKDYKSIATCSCCGKMVENVDRDKNVGMCPKCWEENKENDEMKHFAYLNNFRLKRNSTWSEEIHKKVKEID